MHVNWSSRRLSPPLLFLVMRRPDPKKYFFTVSSNSEASLLLGPTFNSHSRYLILRSYMVCQLEGGMVFVVDGKMYVGYGPDLTKSFFTICSLISHSWHPKRPVFVLLRVGTQDPRIGRVVWENSYFLFSDHCHSMCHKQHYTTSSGQAFREFRFDATSILIPTFWQS
jgi:hypothetical protein